MIEENRWIVVSNRLPFCYDKKKKKITLSSGGLVTALSGVSSGQKKIWVGTVSDSMPKDLLMDYLKKIDDSFEYYPVVIPEKVYNLYYNHFCNEVLWPLFHYESHLVHYSQEGYEAYKEVNRLFSEEIEKIAKKDDLIWINDFHFLLLPQYLKEKRPELKIGHFLHIPFPSSEIFKQLPRREEILEGVLASDLIGFHDSSYLRHFSSSVQKILGLEADLMHINKEGKKIKLGIFPVSIDTKKFIDDARKVKVTKKMASLFGSSEEKKYILSVDRMDYSKGLLLKLKSFQLLLRNNPLLIGKTEMIVLAVPSRTEIFEYRKLKKEVELLISEINGEFSSLNYTPIKYLFKSITREELLALYRRADVMFVTSKRDGMNLVALEYACCQNEARPGSIVISEFTGAASMLSRAMLINPWDIYETSKILKQALERPLSQRKKDYFVMIEFLSEYDASKWANNFMGKITTISESEAWDRETYDLFCDYQMRLPKSYIEKTPNAITWHYSPESGLFANFLATKLCCELDEGLHHSSLEVRKIENGVQVRVKELTKPIEVPVRIETIGSLFPEVHLGR